MTTERRSRQTSKPSTGLKNRPMGLRDGREGVSSRHQKPSTGLKNRVDLSNVELGDICRHRENPPDCLRIGTGMVGSGRCVETPENPARIHIVSDDCAESVGMSRPETQHGIETFA